MGHVCSTCLRRPERWALGHRVCFLTCGAGPGTPPEVKEGEAAATPPSKSLSSHRSLSQSHIPHLPKARAAVGGASLRDGCMFQPPKDEKAEDKGHSGLATLFPGQKRRISHLSKQSKGVSVHFWVLGGGWQQGQDLPLQKQGPRVPLPMAASGNLCPTEMCLRPPSSH